jgi:hypothetical protein
VLLLVLEVDEVPKRVLRKGIVGMDLRVVVVLGGRGAAARKLKEVVGRVRLERVSKSRKIRGRMKGRFGVSGWGFIDVFKMPNSNSSAA